MKSAKSAGLYLLMWVIPFAIMTAICLWAAKLVPLAAIICYVFGGISALIAGFCLFHGVLGLYLGTHPNAWKKWEAGHQNWL